MLLKYARLYRFLVEHAPETAAEVKEVYTTTMSATYQRHIKGYLADCMRLHSEAATKADLVGAEEWGAAASSFAGIFSAKPATARGDAAYKLGERAAVLAALAEPPLIPAVLQQQSKASLHYAFFRSVATLLMDTASTEHDFMAEFFGETDAFDHIFGKAIFLVMESLEGILISSWDAIGCLLLVRVNAEQRSVDGGAPPAAPRLLLPARPGARVVALQGDHGGARRLAHRVRAEADRRGPPGLRRAAVRRARREPARAAHRGGRRDARLDPPRAPCLRSRSSGCSRGKLATLLSSRKHQAGLPGEQLRRRRHVCSPSAAPAASVGALRAAPRHGEGDVRRGADSPPTTAG